MNKKHERHRNTLSDGLQQLPKYKPKEQVWANIAQELEMAAAENSLREAIRQLPTYEPSEAVWHKIESNWQPSTIRKIRWQHRLAVAASICLLAVFGWWLWPKNGATVKVVYNTETMSATTFAIKWNEDEDAFVLLATLCEEQQFICEQPHFQTLQNELAELNTAKQEVQSAIERYGEQSRLLQQLARIERARSDVLKEMVQEI